jgi:hypothetical protein
METGSEVFLGAAEQFSCGSETRGGVDRGRVESTRVLFEPRRSADCERTEAENMYERGTIMMSDWLSKIVVSGRRVAVRGRETET